MLGTAGAVMPGGVLPPGSRGEDGWRRGGKQNKGDEGQPMELQPAGSKDLGIGLDLTCQLNPICESGLGLSSPYM